MMCVSRFAHYLKVMARDKIGSFMEVKECERWLNDWINNYVIANPETAGEETKAKNPLRRPKSVWKPTRTSRVGTSASPTSGRTSNSKASTRQCG